MACLAHLTQRSRVNNFQGRVASELATPKAPAQGVFIQWRGSSSSPRLRGSRTAKQGKSPLLSNGTYLMQMTGASITPKQVMQTDSPEEVLRFAQQALTSGVGCVLVTLVAIIDGAPRALGAHMAVRADGGYCGYVSGGCLESAAAAEALVVLQEGRDRVERFGKGSRFFDIVLPCGGGVDLSFHILKDDTAIATVLGRLEARRPAALAHDTQTSCLQTTDAPAATGWQGRTFYTRYAPALQIFTVGSGFEATVFANLARAAGIKVKAPDIDEIAATSDGDTAVVFLRHDLDSELPMLIATLQGPAFYIGCLGGQRTHARRVQALLDAGVASDQISRIHAPIGLFGPARSVHALACSALAEVVCEYERRVAAK